MKPQAKLILDALLRGERLSPQYSTRRYGVMALAQRVSELRRMGHPILDRFPVVDGKVQHYKVYFMDVPATRPKDDGTTVVREHVRHMSVSDDDANQLAMFA